MKILIELPTWLGDSVMSTPAIENIAHNYPNAKITLIGSKISLEALKNHPKVVKTKVLNKNYSFIREKLEESKLNVAIQVGNAQFLDSAQKPSRPSSPNNKKNIIMGLVIGFGVGVFLALLIEFLDNTLKTIDDIEKYNLGILGIIPSIGDPVKRKKYDHYK